MTPPDPLRSFGAYTEPSREVLEAAAVRVAARRAAPTRPRAAPLLAGSLLAAAALVLAFIASRPLEPIDRVIQDVGAAPLGDAVAARWDGLGRAVGTPRDLRVEWMAGQLAIDVTPKRGVSLTVQTDEATVHVVGTRFDVLRDAEGTTVSVREGRVATRCASGPERVLGAGERVECLPITPAALLGRARAQGRRGADPTEILATLDAVRGDTGAVATEVTLLRAATLADADQESDALLLAEQALEAGGGHRRVELLRLATTLAVSIGGCARASTHASELAALGEPTPCTP